MKCMMKYSLLVHLLNAVAVKPVRSTYAVQTSRPRSCGCAGRLRAVNESHVTHPWAPVSLRETLLFSCYPKR